MASESSFTGFGEHFMDAVAADLHAGLPLPFTPEDDPLSHYVVGPPLSLHIPTFSTNEYLPAFLPESSPPTPGITQDIFHSAKTPNETSTFQSQPTATQPHTALPVTSHNDAAGAKLWSAGFTPSPSGLLPIFSLPVPSAPSVTPLQSNWIKVPQRDYDRGRKRWNFERLAPIVFNVNGSPGINLGDALRKTFTGLDGRDDPVLQEAAGAISCRLLFPGYPANSSSCQVCLPDRLALQVLTTTRKIHALDWTRNRLPITRGKLSHEVAKKVERYLNYIAGFTLDGSVEDRWKAGEGFMHFDNMFLVRLVSVSKGSFQPEIWVADHSAPLVLAG